MIQNIMTQAQSLPKNNYSTTTELANLCGVSRFTIINWVNQGKIKSINTVGGHRRIPVSEVISFLEIINIDQAKIAKQAILKKEKVLHSLSYKIGFKIKKLIGIF